MFRAYLCYLLGSWDGWAGVHGGASALAGAFVTAFWVAAGLITLAVIPAQLLPRRRRALDEVRAVTPVAPGVQVHH
jgi:hypothetical protein